MDKPDDKQSSRSRPEEKREQEAKKKVVKKPDK